MTITRRGVVAGLDHAERREAFFGRAFLADPRLFDVPDWKSNRPSAIGASEVIERRGNRNKCFSEIS